MLLKTHGVALSQESEFLFSCIVFLLNIYAKECMETLFLVRN